MLLLRQPPDFINNSEFIEQTKNLRLPVCTPRANRGTKSDFCQYLNIPCAFDIETTSYTTPNGEKVGLMYEWTFGILFKGKYYITIGRGWESLEQFFPAVSKIFNLSRRRVLVCFVHNLQWEFQFIRSHFNFTKVFALKKYEPVTARCDLGIEFRCSYLLTGKPLYKLAEDTPGAPPKLRGDLDYELNRHEKTPLLWSELDYCVNDVKIILAFIEHRIKIDKSIAKMPITKTGYVRQFLRRACFYEDALTGQKNKYQKSKYTKLISKLTIEPDEYLLMKRAYSGGIVHASPWYAGKVIANVISMDFTSSYPASVVIERGYPMSKGRRVSVKTKAEFFELIKTYCCIFDIRFINIRSKTHIEHLISASKCFELAPGALIDNGRVVDADFLSTSITEVDFAYLSQFYEWDDFQLSSCFYIYKRGYLPTEFIKGVLKLYSDKTTLKGVTEREFDFRQSKENLNSCYGCMVTDIIRDDIEYDNEWKILSADLAEKLNAYNNNKNRFLFYPWGIYVTALSRLHLATGILACGSDYLYCDTDSVKIKNPEKHKDYFEWYNKRNDEKLKAALFAHKIPEEYGFPKNQKGEIKPLGEWDFDGSFKRYKAIRAKCYIAEDESGIFSITIAGVNKKIGARWLQENFADPFEGLVDGLHFPPEATGKLTHTYIDEPRHGLMADYLGNTAEYHELTGIHLSPCDYTLSLVAAYCEFLRRLRQYAD